MTIDLKSHIQRIIVTILAMASLFGSYAKAEVNGPVVIVSSYSPREERMKATIDEFCERYKSRGGDGDNIRIENMNCGILAEATEWKENLWKLLSKYYADGQKPSMIVLLGNEASTAFFSTTIKEIRATPVVVGIRSNNIVRLPNDRNIDIKTWDPRPYYLNKDFKDYKIIGGYVYKLDVSVNLELLHDLYPKRDSIVFLSDNTIGGITLRAHFKHTMKNHPHYKIEWIDGREMTFQEVNNAIHELKGNKAILVGTWRMDNSETLTLNNTTVSLGKSNKAIPAISLSSTGLGDWAIGGYIPDYQNVGAKLADDVIKYEQTGLPPGLHMLSNIYKFDYEKLKEFKIPEEKLPEEYVLVNKPESIFETYTTQIIITATIIVLLIMALTVSLHYLILSKKLEKSLIQRGNELEIARDKAEKANAMKSAFIANMSHEIRTPLNAIVGFSQLLTEPDIPLTTEEKTEYGGYIKMNSDTLLNLVNDILQISKMDAKSLVFNIVDTDMVEICRTAAESARTNLTPGVSIETKLPNHPVPVQTDILRLQQVFNNLLSNAKKFTDHGTITVAIEFSPVPDEIRISVTDTGCGIPADKADYVFQRFKQIDSFKPGTGLGLSITRSIIENLGGRIWLDTEYHNGARFVFSHPTKQKK
jgi:signal transduction histidine kinase